MTNTGILYCFESNKYMLFETKITNKKETDKSKNYYWILYDKSNDEVKKLDFISMDGDERLFSQGKLIFNDKNGKFFYKGNMFILNRLSNSDSLNIKLINIISDDLLKNIN